jgi:hypothetical protein
LTYHAQYVRDITTQISFVRSGLTYNRSNRTYYGTITIANNGADTLSNLLPVALTALPAGVTLVNAAGTFNGTPYVNTGTVNSLPPGASTVPVHFQFAGGTLNYGIAVYSFH